MPEQILAIMLMTFGLLATKDFQNPDGTLKSASQIKKEFALPSTPKHRMHISLWNFSL
jgi:hypothetical protein